MYGYIRSGHSVPGQCWSYVEPKRKIFRSKNELLKDFFIKFDIGFELAIDKRRAKDIKIKVINSDGEVFLKN